MKKLSILIIALLIATPSFAADFITYSIRVPTVDVPKVIDAYEYVACVGEQTPDEDGCSDLNSTRFIQRELAKFVKDKVRNNDRKIAKNTIYRNIVDITVTETD